MDSSHNFAKDFNKRIDLRLYLWKNGFMSNIAQLPGLLRQERESLYIYLLILFKLYLSEKLQPNPEGNVFVKDTLFKRVEAIFIQYTARQKEINRITKLKLAEQSDEQLEQKKSMSFFYLILAYFVLFDILVLCFVNVI